MPAAFFDFKMIKLSKMNTKGSDRPIQHYPMLRKISLAALLLIGCTGLLHAQDDRQVSINVTAIVNGAVETITIQTIDFENIERENSVVTVNPITSPRAGKMIARGTPNAEFQIDYLRERVLDNANGPGNIIFTYTVAGNIIDVQETSEILSQEVRDLTFNNDGEYFIWVGGFADITNAEPGTYIGEFTIEIEYI